MNKKKIDLLVWIVSWFTFVLAIISMWTYWYLKDKDIFKQPPMECWIVFTKIFTDQQYVWQYSMWRVAIIKSGSVVTSWVIVGIKTYKISDYVEEWNIICKQRTERIKQDMFLVPIPMFVPFNLK